LLLASDTKTADASGKAVCQVQPLRAFESWKITNTAVQSTSTAIPTVKTYRGGESPSSFLEGSYTANFNSSDTVIDLNNGERLLVVFEGCTPGASCSVSVSGEKVGRNGI
jgi:hypothetical protein